MAMTRIEVIFGGILVLAVIAAGSLVLFQNGFQFVSIGAGQSGSAYARTPAANAAEPAVFTGIRETDLCTCYETGFARGSESGGSENGSIESVAYRGGFTSCRAELGAEGGNAWTEGWINGADNRLSQRSCRIYMKRVSLQ